MIRPAVSDLSGELARLQRKIRDARTKRAAAEREAAGRHTVELALEAAARDRDALSSPELETLRARADGLVTRLQGAWTGIDAIRVFAGMLSNSGVNLTGEPGLIGGATLAKVLHGKEQRPATTRAELTEWAIS